MLQRFHYHVYVNTQQHAAVLQQFPDIQQVFKHKATIISKSDQSEVFKHETGQQSYFIKRYYKTRGLLSWFGFSRFRTEVRNQYWFNQLNIPSATLIASGEDQRFLKTRQAYLITEGLDSTQDLATIANNTPAFFADTARMRILLSRTASLLKSLHQHYFCHNDLHWRNLLVDVSLNEPNVFLIDCPSGHFLWSPFFRYKRIKELANLDKVAPDFFSRTQRLRFFLTYQGIQKLSKGDKDLIRDVFRHKQHRAIRKHKSGLSLLLLQLKFTVSHYF